MSRLLSIAAVALIAGSAPAQSPTVSRVAFGSCAKQDRPVPAWDAIVAGKPDLFLFLGDNIYADTTDMAVMKAKYQQLAAQPGFQKLLKTCPVMATWDDHDYGQNDAGAEYPKKVEAQQVLLDFFRDPSDSPRRSREGVYDAKIFGPPGKRVQVILLDTRYFRSPLRTSGRAYVPNPDPNATMLGDVQWGWLEAQLKQPAELRLIGSSIQVVPEDHPFEKWMNLPLERERLFKLIRDTNAGGVVFLSGDRHLAELSVIEDAVGYPLFDLTSSGLNQGFRRWREPERNSRRVFTMTHGNNYGVVAVDWSQADPVVSLQIRDEGGDLVFQQKLPLSLLKPSSRTVAAPAESRMPEVPDATGVLTVAAAAQMTNRRVTLEMEVQSVGTTRDKKLAFLNSARNYRDKENFTVAVVRRSTADKFRERGIDEEQFPNYFRDKKIRVTGTVTLFRDNPQIVVDDADQIVVVEK